MSEMMRYLKEADKKSTIVLIGGMVLLCVYIYQGHPPFYYAHIAPYLTEALPPDLMARWWQFGLFFMLCFIIPVVLIKLYFKENLRDYGMQIGDARSYVPILIPALVLLIPALYVSTMGSDFQAEYPMAKSATQSIRLFVLYEMTYLFYYVPWEFFFRGFLLFGCRKAYGDMGAILIQTIPSTLLHIGKPMGETWGALAAGIAFGAIVLRTRSILPVFIFHYAMGVVNDVFCAYHGGLFP